MSVYQNDIKRIMKQLLLIYETKIVYDKERKLERLGISELAILEYLDQEVKVTLNDLLMILDLKRTKALSIIKKLQEHDYIRKENNPEDRRSSYLVLTLKGQACLNSYTNHEAHFLEFVLKDMTINEEKTIVKFLSKIQQTQYMK